jgi:hypothetical protein
MHFWRFSSQIFQKPTLLHNRQVYSKVKFPKIYNLGHCFKIQIDTRNSIKTIQILEITGYFASKNMEELKLEF